jgi:cyclopropane fatty-acyl-phospholipid synthase-like methyltransferase
MVNGMDDEQQQEIARAFEMSPELLPYIPELIADLWELGSSLEVIVGAIRPLELPEGQTRVLDLGCGKGAISITLAKEFGFQALGIDLFEPFVQEARAKAKEMHVGALCQFVHGDMRDAIKSYRNFDVAVYAAVGSALGTWDQCVAKIRRCVRPEGFIVIDDGYLAGNEKVDRSGYEHYVGHEETLQQLTAHGDTLLREVTQSQDYLKSLNSRFLESIRKRVEKLSKKHPEAADILRGYVKDQELESEIIETMLTGAVWLLQRT